MSPFTLKLFCGFSFCHSSSHFNPADATTNSFHTTAPASVAPDSGTSRNPSSHSPIHRHTYHASRSSFARYNTYRTEDNHHHGSATSATAGANSSGWNPRCGHPEAHATTNRHAYQDTAPAVFQCIAEKGIGSYGA